MTGPAPLTPQAADQLIAALRTGQELDDAVAALGLDIAGVWAAVRTHTRLAVAVAGRDPDTAAERARIARADYLRLLALGLRPSRADLAIGEGDAGSWRGTDPAYAEACAAVSAAAASYTSRDRGRMTPDVTAKFLKALRNPHTTVKDAAAQAGVTHTAVYKRRSRDAAFAAAMDRARASGRMTPDVTAKFLKALRNPHTTVKDAAAQAGVTYTAVYKRRSRDAAFAAAMDRARGAHQGVRVTSRVHAKPSRKQ